MSPADPTTTILVVEDDAPTRTFLADNLTADGYELLVADCASEGIRLLETKFPDIALVDLGLPDGSGLEIVRRVRAADGVASRIDPATPVVVLTGRAGELDRLRGFARGCDDYIAKPFSYAELRARLEALLRRAQLRKRPGRLRAGELEVDAPSRVVRVRGTPIDLSQKEFALARMLASEPTRVFTRISYGSMSEQRAVAYLRVSEVGDRAARGRFESPELQRLAINQWCEQRGIRVVQEIRDLNSSGGTLTRPGLAEAMALIPDAADGIVVARGDRASRKTLHGLGLIDTLAAQGGWIAAADGTIDTTTRAGRMATTMHFAMGENELDRIRETSAVVHRRAILEKGRHMGPAPFGYGRGADGRLVVDDLEAGWVRYVFERRADGRGWVEISRELAAAGVKQRNGRALNPHMLRRMVERRVYLGEAAHGEHVRAGAHAPLVDEVLWQAANRAQPTVRSDVKQRDHDDSLLRGLLRCAGCRYVLKRLPHRTGPPRRRCRTVLAERAATHDCDAPATLTGREGVEVEAQVVEEFFALAAGVAVEPSTTTAKVADLERRVRDAEALLDELSTLAVREQLGAERWGRMVTEARDSHTAATEELARARAQARMLPGVDRVTLEAAWEGMTLPEKQEALRSIVQAVMVDSDGGIDVVAVWEPADLPRKGASGFVARPWER
jgi:DNA-binding response OmpR family regulator/DNA invertase Pin-like site-specific DNA recombinase